MMHLVDDEIYELAQITEEYLTYDSRQLEQMEHLKICADCYNKFCSAMAAIEVTSESGYIVLSEIYEINKNIQKVSSDKKILAAVQIARENLEGSAAVFIRQIEQAKAMFKFAPALATALRGGNGINSNIFRAEDINDERTFIMFDAKKRELMIQIDCSGFTSKDVKVYLFFEKFEMRELHLEKKGEYLKGFLKGIPDDDFRLQIECIKHDA